MLRKSMSFAKKMLQKNKKWPEFDSLSILDGIFGLFSFQSFFFVGEVSVVLLLASKTTAVVLCHRKVVVDVT